MLGRSKSVEFRGSAIDDLRAFRASARREAGHQLDQVQQGRDADDWKPLNTIGRAFERFAFGMRPARSE